MKRQYCLAPSQLKTRPRANQNWPWLTFKKNTRIDVRAIWTSTGMSTATWLTTDRPIMMSLWRGKTKRRGKRERPLLKLIICSMIRCLERGRLRDKRLGLRERLRSLDWVRKGLEVVVLLLRRIMYLGRGKVRLLCWLVSILSRFQRLKNRRK